MIFNIIYKICAFHGPRALFQHCVACAILSLWKSCCCCAFQSIKNRCTGNDALQHYNHWTIWNIRTEHWKRPLTINSTTTVKCWWIFFILCCCCCYFATHTFICQIHQQKISLHSQFYTIPLPSIMVFPWNFSIFTKNAFLSIFHRCCCSPYVSILCFPASNIWIGCSMTYTRVDL